MQHTDQARAVARDTGWNLDEHAAERGWSGVGIGPVGQSRDSDTLERCNYAVILSDLEGYHVDVARFGHWAVGWVEEISYDTGDRDTVRAVHAWRDKLADYPVADENVLSELEYEELHAYVELEVGEALAGDVADALAEEGLALGSVNQDEIRSALHWVADGTARYVRKCLALAHAGHGQLTLDGDEVVLPERPDPGYVAELVDRLELECPRCYPEDGPCDLDEDGAADTLRTYLEDVTING